MVQSEIGTDEAKQSVGQLLKRAERYVTLLNLPQMQKPEEGDRDYAIPNNIAALDDRSLANLQQKLSNWATWLMGVLGKEESEHEAIKTTFDLALGRAMASADKKLTAAAAKAVAISEDEELDRLQRVLIRKQAVLTRLRAQLKIYESQVTRLSREQSRREADARIA